MYFYVPPEGLERGDGLFSLLPWKKADSIYVLTGPTMTLEGIRFLMMDLDNTLCPYSQSEPDDRLRAWQRELEAAGVTLFLLSNSRKPTRVAHFAQSMGIRYMGHAGKPKTGGYLRAMEENGFTPKESAMIGDQIFTDTLGANRAGIRSILVKPISLAGNPGRYLRYWVELPMRLLSRNRRWGRKDR